MYSHACMKTTTAATQWSSTRSCTEASQHLPSACPQHMRQVFHLCCSFAIYLMVSVTAPRSRWQWEVQNSFLAPPGGRGRSAIHLARVEPSSICLCVTHLHPRAVGATETSCLIPRNHIANHLPQDSSSASRSVQL